MATNFSDQELEAQQKAREEETKAREVTVTFTVSDTALRIVRTGFNPSQLNTVARIHLMAAGLITILEQLRDRTKPEDDGKLDVPRMKLWQALDDAKRQAAIGITHIETASMFGVKAATAEAYAAKN